MLHIGPTGFAHRGEVETVALGEELDLVIGQRVRLGGGCCRDAFAVVEGVATVLVLNCLHVVGECDRGVTPTHCILQATLYLQQR